MEVWEHLRSADRREERRKQAWKLKQRGYTHCVLTLLTLQASHQQMYAIPLSPLHIQFEISPVWSSTIKRSSSNCRRNRCLSPHTGQGRYSGLCTQVG